MRFVITGDECGLLKESLPIARKEKLEVTGANVKLLTDIEEMSRSNGMVDLVYLNEDETRFAALLKDGRLRTFSIDLAPYDDPKKLKHSTYKLLQELPALYDAGGGEEEPNDHEVAIGLYRFESKVCVCSSKGRMNIFDPENNDTTGEEDHVVPSYLAYETPQHVSAHAGNGQEGLVAMGGKDRETVIWDTNQGKQIWKAKNLPPDPQTLLQPQVWPTAATFLNAQTLAVGTAYHQIRIYDIRLPSQRRPISYTPFDESLFAHRITALCPHSNSATTVFVGDSAGFLSELDTRMLRGGAILRQSSNRAIVGRFVGPSGSIRQIKTGHGTLGCVGLDRMLRIFDLKSRRQIHEIYLKQRVNCLLMSNTEEVVSSDGDSDADVDVEDKLEDYIGSSDEELDEEDANPFEEDTNDGGFKKKRRL